MLRARASHSQPGGLVCEPAHCLTYAGPLQFQGENRLLAFLVQFNLGSGQISQGRVCSLPIGEGAGWSSTHSSRCGVGFGEMQHSLKAGSHPGEGGLRGQGVRLDCSNEHTRAHPSVVAKGMSASHPHQPSFPLPRTTPIFPRRPIVVNAAPHKQACQMLRCQLPKARGRLPTGQLPQLQKQVYPSASTPTSSRVTCVFV